MLTPITVWANHFDCNQAMPKIATWNVNSIRTRLDQVCQWLDSTGADYLCLQETKVTDAEFPRQIGRAHV